MTCLLLISNNQFDIYILFYMTFSQVDMVNFHFDKLCVSFSQCFQFSCLC